MTDTEQALERAIQTLEIVFPGCAIVLLVSPFGGPPNQRVNYVGNGERADVLVMLKELIARWEGRHQEAPSTKQ